MHGCVHVSGMGMCMSICVYVCVCVCIFVCTCIILLCVVREYSVNIYKTASVFVATGSANMS